MLVGGFCCGQSDVRKDPERTPERQRSSSQSNQSSGLLPFVMLRCMLLHKDLLDDWRAPLSMVTFQDYETIKERNFSIWRLAIGKRFSAVRSIAFEVFLLIENIVLVKYESIRR